MSARPDTTVPAPTRQARRSVGVASLKRANMDLGADSGSESRSGSGSGSLALSRKKSRSKSMGPGGLDALKQGSGNRRVSLAAPARPPPRSILKPPPSPEIPLPASQKQNSDLIDLGGGEEPSWQPASLKKASSLPIPSSSSQDGTPSGSANRSSKVALRTEEEQQKSARLREERERRDARRKSLANRRVSFAVEATLHTFHDIEYIQDSTTSTEATRPQSAQSSTAAQEQGPAGDHGTGLDPNPAEGQLQRRSRRRSSGIGSDHDGSPGDDPTMASVYSDYSAGDMVEEIIEDEGSSDGGDSDADDGTLMTVDDAEMTGVSALSAVSARTTASDDSTLASALRIASASAASHRFLAPATAAAAALDEGEEIIPAFIPWTAEKESDGSSSGEGGLSASNREEDADTHADTDTDIDMDLTQAVGRIVESAAASAASVASAQSGAPRVGDDEEDMSIDMSMDVTRAIGGIIHSDVAIDMPSSERITNDVPLADHPDHPDLADQTMEMELTMAVGSIRQPDHHRHHRVSDGGAEEDEDMSMDITNIIGGVMGSVLGTQSAGRGPAAPPVPAEVTAAGIDMDMDMDMTVGIGRILRHGPMPGAAVAAVEEDDDDGDHTAAMDVTTAMGGILKSRSPSSAESRRLSKRIMEAEVDEPSSPLKAALAVASSLSHSAKSLFSLLDPIRQDSPQAPGPGPQQGARPPNSPAKAAAPATPQQLRQASPRRTTSRSAVAGRAPVQMDSPANAKSPAAARSPAASKTVAKTVPSPRRDRRASEATVPKSPVASSLARDPPDTGNSNSGDGGGSNSTTPADRRQRSLGGIASARQPTSTPKLGRLFKNRAGTGNPTPSVVLGPWRGGEHEQQRPPLWLPPGVGADPGSGRPAPGSPKIAAVLVDRRGSIAEPVKEFVLEQSPQISGSRAVRFRDLAQAETEEEGREQERGGWGDGAIVQREPYRYQSPEDDDYDDPAPTNLRDIIDSMSPKKNPSRGRKSLHVGSARGLLGKRPAELDEEEADPDQDEYRGGAKRLKNHQGSPIRNTPSNQRPPATPRMTDASTPLPQTETATTPNSQSRRRNVNTGGDSGGSTPTPVANLSEPAGIRDNTILVQEAPEDGITLAQFLDMTSIRFVGLEATERLDDTAIPAIPADPVMIWDRSPSDGQQTGTSLASCVVAAACTAPLGEHSGGELKQHISEGQRVVRGIEAEIWASNPPIFREYMTATPEARAQMDKQFKNIKMHTRLLTNAMWYEWRMKLLHILREGLTKIRDGMLADDELFRRQENLVGNIMLKIERRLEDLRAERDRLEILAACDPQEVETARSELASLGRGGGEKQADMVRLADDDAAAAAAGIEVAGRPEGRQVLGVHEEAREADSIRHRRRSWAAAEVGALKARAADLEMRHGWMISGAAGTVLTMTYRREIELTIDTAGVLPHQPNRQPDPDYRVDVQHLANVPATEEQEFYLARIRAHICGLPAQDGGIAALGRVVGVVRAGWDAARSLATSVHRVRLVFPTKVARISDSTLEICIAILMVPLRSKIEVILTLKWGGGSGAGSGVDGGVHVTVHPTTRVIYGENFNVAKIGEFLATRLGEVGAEMADWSGALVELRRRLIARGQR